MRKDTRVPAGVARTAGGKTQKRKMRHTNKTKVIFCYAILWSLAILVPLAGLWWVFPYKLVGTSPEIAKTVAEIVPGLQGVLAESIQAASFSEGMTAVELGDMIAARDLQWRVFVGGLAALLWIISLNVQLIWRSFYVRPVGVTKASFRAVRSYRLTMLCILALNAGGAFLVYAMGMQFITGRTLWDWLIYMNGFALNALAAFVCFRFAAPPAISGKYSFFKRL